MTKKLLISISLASAACVSPLPAQSLDKFTTNIGGGISSPLNPTSQYTGLSGNFSLAAGYKIGKNDAVVGEFQWNGLPPNLFVLHPVDAPRGSINLYSLAANYRHQIDRIHGSPFGLYAIAGGGWYYRHASVDKDYVVPPGTVCQPIYTYWGYGCYGGYVYTAQVAYRGLSAPGLDAGVGFTIRFADSNWRFYTEARYIYAFHSNVATTLVPVTLGIRFN